jgi:hypothetical protein
MIEVIGPLVQLVTTVDKSLSVTLSSSSDRTLHGSYSDLQLSCQLLLSSHCIASGWSTAQKTHPLPSNGYMRTHTENISCNTWSIVACGSCGRCLEMGLHVTIDGDDLSASRQGRFSPEERAPSRHWLGSWVDGRSLRSHCMGSWVGPKASLYKTKTVYWESNSESSVVKRLD